MKPGKELNDLIASKLFGWKFTKLSYVLALNYNRLHVHPKIKDHFLLEPPEFFDIPEDGRDRDHTDAPNYSTDIASAWLVVEKLRSLGFSVDVSSYPNEREWLKPPYDNAPAPEWVLSKGTEYYQCSISRHEPDAFGWISVCDPLGETPSHAICLAALEALERN